ncbi:hypothetical protein DNTS_023026 [Danionella cerebrum]|uniref:RING-type domain-containing protein n=1 Tax=Danionella cerebrum TaxID=2873325 RepID=A0A553QM00_9TELE|nr:hypothetical protein DNTS_023026 [Danionella translucida]
MAESSISLVPDKFFCSICLDLLKDPVAIHCGHSYCQRCITHCWDQEDQKQIYSCPQCRQSFTPRPSLGENVMLAEVVEKLKKNNQQAALDQCCTDVECDACTGDKNQAIKSCLTCLDSFCQDHLQQHENLFKMKKHNLMDATRRLQEMICSQHEKPLEIFCRSEQKCICWLCLLDEHKNHLTVSAATERAEKQRQLTECQAANQRRIEMREKELQELRAAIESHKCSAQAAVKDTESIFTELICSIESICSELTKLIRDQEKIAVRQAEDQLERLQQEIENLKRSNTELEQLSNIQHHVHFIQSFQSLSNFPGSTDSPSITITSQLTFDHIPKSVCHLREKLDDFFQEEMDAISTLVRSTACVTIPEPSTREEFLRYYRHFTLDENTINKYLILSDDNRTIAETDTSQQYPDHPDRFNSLTQVLCTQSACERCYWEVEWSGRGVSIAVSYKSICRKGRRDECAFGYNDRSWSFSCFPCTYLEYSFCHDNKETELLLVSTPSRIGVYLDHSAGTLSFYSVSDTMSLIHRVHTTFTEPLYPGFRVYESVKLCDVGEEKKSM